MNVKKYESLSNKQSVNYSQFLKNYEKNKAVIAFITIFLYCKSSSNNLCIKNKNEHL
jgi:hypothetical protein